jgi:hypothetical protein
MLLRAKSNLIASAELSPMPTICRRSARGKAQGRALSLRPALRVGEGENGGMADCETVPREAFRETMGVTVLCAVRDLRGVSLDPI